MKKFLLMISLCFMCLFLNGCNNNVDISISYNTDNIYIVADSYSNKIEHDKINSFELKDSIIYDNLLLDGIKYDNSEIGIFENDELGKYISYLEKDSTKCIIIYVEENIPVVIGLTNTDKLDELHNKLVELA
ncbi:MAG: hypothetical protein R3Y05_06730 [bacterium]